MAAMLTPVTLFSINGTRVTYETTGHTPAEPRLVIQDRRIPQNGSGVSKSTVKVVYGTTDANGDPLSDMITLEASTSFPLKGAVVDLDAALATFRDVVAGDEFAAAFKTQALMGS